MLLRDIPPLLREEPGFASVLGRSSAVLAVPEPARALTLAGLATLSSRRPLVVATPTTGDADRLAADLRTFLGDDAVDTFPASAVRRYEYAGVTPVPLRDATYARVGVATRTGEDNPAVRAFRAVAGRVAEEHLDRVPEAVAPGYQASS